LRIFVITFLILLAISCSLERSNPLDPENGGTIPISPDIKQFSIITTTSGDKQVLLMWDQLNSVAGYYLYRSLSYNGQYDLLTKIENNQTYEYFDTDVISGKTYFYKMSAYNQQGLEGYLSGITIVTVE